MIKTNLPATRETTVNDVFAELCLAKLTARDTKGIDPLPGKYEVRAKLQVDLRARMGRSEDSSYTPTAEIPLIPTLALVLEKSGFTRDVSAKLLVEAMTEAIEGGQKAEFSVSHQIQEIEIAMDRVRKQIVAKLPKKTRKGSLRVEGTADIDILEAEINPV